MKGNAPPCPADKSDIIDETLQYFRANVLFRNFPVLGPADLLLAYLTAFTAQVLREFAKYKTKSEATSKITSVSMSTSFSIPGESSFPLGGFFKAPSARSDGDTFRTYLRQAREELCNRLLDIAYTSTGEQNKWWIQFSKRKFMNITSVRISSLVQFVSSLCILGPGRQGINCILPFPACPLIENSFRCRCNKTQLKSEPSKHRQGR